MTLGEPRRAGRPRDIPGSSLGVARFLVLGLGAMFWSEAMCAPHRKFLSALVPGCRLRGRRNRLRRRIFDIMERDTLLAAALVACKRAKNSFARPCYIQER